MASAVWGDCRQLVMGADTVAVDPEAREPLERDPIADVEAGWRRPGRDRAAIGRRGAGSPEGGQRGAPVDRHGQ